MKNTVMLLFLCGLVHASDPGKNPLDEVPEFLLNIKELCDVTEAGRKEGIIPPLQWSAALSYLSQKSDSNGIVQLNTTEKLLAFRVMMVLGAEMAASKPEWSVEYNEYLNLIEASDKVYNRFFRFKQPVHE